MIKGKKVLGLIPARGGSKGIKDKNLININGKPLIAWTIEHAKNSKYIDDIILSSDSEKIMRVAQKHGCKVPFKRPRELATDQASSIDTALHALNFLREKYDYLILLQVTSPLRLSSDIDACLEICEEKEGHHSCVSVSRLDKPLNWLYSKKPNGSLSQVLPKNEFITRRQDAEKIYYPNGAVYVARTQWLLKEKRFISDGTVGYELPKERSLDIDTPLDLVVLKTLINS